MIASVLDATIAESGGQSQALWRIRETIPEAARGEPGMLYRHDISVAVSAVPDFVRESLTRLNVPGYKVFRWERHWRQEGQPFRDPAPGRWTAEIYLLFAEGRPDVFPAGDLAVLVELGKLLLVVHAHLAVENPYRSG